MKKTIFVCVLAFLMMGCTFSGNEENIQTKKELLRNIDYPKELSELYFWEEAKIRNVDYYPKFQCGLIVQNDSYVFFPKDGNRIIRINKATKEEMTILEFNLLENKRKGARICLSDMKLYVEYEGNIYSTDFDGKNTEKIISSIRLKKLVAKMINEKAEKCPEIRAIQYYKGDLYFYAGLCIYKLDIETKTIIELADYAYNACFCDNDLYYIGPGATVIYKVDLSTLKQILVKGRVKCVDDELDGTMVYYETVMETNGGIYYVRKPQGKNSALYRLCESGKDEKVLDFKAKGERIYGVNSGLSKVVYQYNALDENGEWKDYLKVYDINTSVTHEVERPVDYGTCIFVTGDMVFYHKNTSDDQYLSFLTI